MNRQHWKYLKDLLSLRKQSPDIDPAIDDNISVEDFGIHKSVIRGDNLFKGHKFNLIYSNQKTNEKGYFSLYQSYFRGSVTSSYNIKEGTTLNTWIVTGISPRWLTTKLNAAGMILTKLEANYSHTANFTLENKDNPNLNIWAGCYTLKYSEVSEGFDMKNHRENIDELKKLSEHWKKIRTSLKEKTPEEIVKICRNTGVNLYSHSILQLIYSDMRDLV